MVHLLVIQKWEKGLLSKYIKPAGRTWYMRVFFIIMLCFTLYSNMEVCSYMSDRYLLKERSEDSILLILLIRVMDALGSYGKSTTSNWSKSILVLYVICDGIFYIFFLEFKRVSLWIFFLLCKYNLGSLEYEEWSNHVQAWKLESAAIIEPPCNFIISSHAKGKRRLCPGLLSHFYILFGL